MTPKEKKHIFKLFRSGKSAKEIAEITQTRYETVYYHLVRKGLIEKRIPRIRIKQKDHQFDYCWYITELLKRSRKLKNISRAEFKQFCKTEEGWNFVGAVSTHFTPHVFLTLVQAGRIVKPTFQIKLREKETE